MTLRLYINQQEWTLRIQMTMNAGVYGERKPLSTVGGSVNFWTYFEQSSGVAVVVVAFVI